jgi:hypothetical protein
MFEQVEEPLDTIVIPMLHCATGSSKMKCYDFKGKREGEASRRQRDITVDVLREAGSSGGRTQSGCSLSGRDLEDPPDTVQIGQLGKLGPNK